MLVVAAMGSWWAYIGIIPAVIAMCGISYCRARKRVDD